MKIPNNINNDVLAIAQHIYDTYRLPKDGMIGMRNDKYNLFQFYITLENDGVSEVHIEQFNGDEGSYARLSTIIDLVNDPTKTIGPITDCSKKIGSVTDEHVWVRFHHGDPEKFVQSMCLIIQHGIKTHKIRLLSEIDRISAEYENIINTLKNNIIKLS